MPKEKIAQTFVDNGTETHVNSLLITWGPKGGAPDAPNGWVNAGFTEIGILRDNGAEGEIDSVFVSAADMDHLIRVLKRVRRKTFEASRLDKVRAIAMTDPEVDSHLKAVGLG